MATIKRASIVQEWLTEIKKALARERDYRKEAREVIKIYEGDNSDEHPFNILFSNVETMGPALYNSTPRPLVKRRFQKGEDPVSKAAAQIAQNLLEYLLDTDFREETTFDSMTTTAVTSALVTGRGVSWISYDADFEKEEETERVEAEYLCLEEVPWDRFLHGYGKVWKEVPWVSREHFMSKEELEENFGKDIAKKVEMVAVDDTVDSEKEAGGDAENAPTLGHVYEIWDKESKSVIFISPGYADGPLKKVRDPLQLTGFFPCPEPLRFFKRITGLTPVPPYQFYRQQARELNRVTVRIQKIIAALKVRGFYDDSIAGIDRVMQADDNTLIPAENVVSLQDKGGLEKALFLMPIEKLVTVLQQLYQQRQEIKQVIYEITGLADIMRGASVASETLGAQQLKNQWGTLRLKRSQKAVSDYVRETLRIMAEIAVTKFSPDTIRGMTGLKFPLEAEQAQARLIAQQAQLNQQQPPQQVIATLQQPAFEELLKLLQDDTQRSYHIDIETNSTVDAEATEDKQDMAELMNSVAQFLNGIAPAVEKGALPFDAAKAMLLGIVRRFRFGREVEEMLATMQPPQPPQQPQGPSPEAEKQMQELKKLQADVQKQLDQLDLRSKELQQEAQFLQRQIQQEREFALREVESAAKQRETEHAARVETAAEQLNLRQQFAEATMQSRADQLKETSSKMESTAQSLSPDTLAKPIVESLTPLLEQFATQLVQSIQQQLSQPKRAKKLEDGTWTTF